VGCDGFIEYIGSIGYIGCVKCIGYIGCIRCMGCIGRTGCLRYGPPKGTTIQPLTNRNDIIKIIILMLAIQSPSRIHRSSGYATCGTIAFPSAFMRSLSIPPGIPSSTRLFRALAALRGCRPDHSSAHPSKVHWSPVRSWLSVTCGLPSSR